MLFEGVRKKIGQYLLNKEVNAIQRKPKLFSMSSVNTAILLFECNDETMLALVNKLIKRLREEEGWFKISAIAFYQGKETPDYLSKAKYVTPFGENELNWHLFPQSETVSQLLKEEYDILLDLSLEEQLPLKVLTTKLKAKMKIGKRRTDNLDILDMFVNIGDSGSMPYLIEQVIHFLKMFNKSKLKHG